MLVTASANTPPAISESMSERLEGPDRGLINAWLVGLEKRKTDPAIAMKAIAGELPPLPFKGGVEKKIKSQTKVGSLWYVASWRGLRGEDLCIDTDTDIRLVCSKTGVPVTYTLDIKRLFSSTAEE